MKNREWVVAVAVSLITANITGNVVIRQGFGRQVQVANTNDVLNMLNKCEMTDYLRKEDFTSVNGYNCNSLCNNKRKTCISSFLVIEDYPEPSNGINFISGIGDCSFNFKDYFDLRLTEEFGSFPRVQCVCCLP
ncbi:hypothetical protein J4466_02015 [Candidatus Pacearchaeota archaeon]|nr:hypothetical protein [Candidatus Pacearchaeota archaeon]